MTHQGIRGSARWGTALAALIGGGAVVLLGQQAPQDAEGFRFRTGVELVNVTATVTDQSGRFVSGLTKDDFRIVEDGQPQSISHFSADRVPVSLGIVLDTSGSMAGSKMTAAQNAIDRFLFELLDADDEIFIYRFSNQPDLVQDWTSDRRRLSAVLNRIVPSGGTAMYDAVAEAVPLATTGTRRKKAVLLISDGNDTNSSASVEEVKQLVRETEVLVYAIGIDGRSTTTQNAPRIPTGRRTPMPFPFPIPGRSRPPWGFPQPPSLPGSGGVTARDERVNVAALREITDDSGGRTEIVRSAADLDPATTGVADELSRQYYLGYASTGRRDGRWHSITVNVDNPAYRVRARRGFIAS
jgi:VWFA-related protein